MIKIFFLLIFVFDFLTFNVRAYAEEQLSILADQLEFQRNKNLIYGSGNIEIWYKDKSIFGDKVEFDTETGSGSIAGNVVFYDAENQIISEAAEFNLKTGTGTLHKAVGTIASRYYLTGERLEKISTDKYTILEGSLTTCCEDIPPWRFRIKKATIHVESYAFLTGSYFLIKNIPIFYLPYWIIPIKTKRATGFLTPEFGSSNKDGYFINNSLFWAINDQQDATIYLTYLEKKGIREELEYRYILSKNSSGIFSGSYLKESDTERDFWKINYDHNQIFPYDVQGVVKIDSLSKANPDREYEDDANLRTRRFTDSHIRITKSWFSRSLQIIGRKRDSTESDYNETYTQLPEISFTNQKERIRKSPFFFSMDSSLTIFKNEKGKEKIDLERADIYPKITFSFHNHPWFTLTPTIGVRETYYSKGINRNDGFTRDLYDIELKTEGPKFFRVFNTSIKHLIEPRIIYKYIPDTDDKDIGDIIQIDPVDGVVPQNTVSYYLTNRVLKKSFIENEKYKTGEILRLEISQQYNIAEATRNDTPINPRRPFSDLRFDFDTHVIEPLIFNFDTTYDVYNSRINTANIDIGINHKDLWYITTERRYTRQPESTFITGITGINVKNVNFQYSSRYDETNKEFMENDYSITYSAACWETSFDIANRKYFINTEEKSEIKFFFLITLKDVVSIGKKGNLGLIQRKI